MISIYVLPELMALSFSINSSDTFSILVNEVFFWNFKYNNYILIFIIYFLSTYLFSKLLFSIYLITFFDFFDLFFLTSLEFLDFKILLILETDFELGVSILPNDKHVVSNAVDMAAFK